MTEQVQTGVPPTPAATPPAASPSTPVVPTPAAVPRSDGDTLSLAEKAAAIRRDEARLAQARKAHEKDLADAADWRKRIDEAKANPAKALDLLGLTLEQVQVAHLEAAKRNEPVNQATAEAREAKEQVAKLQKQLEEREMAARVEGIRSDIRTKIAADEAGADLLRVYRSGDGSYDGIDFVCDVMVAHHRETGEDLPIADAIAAAEKTLEKDWIDGLAKSKKLQAKFQPTKDTKDAPAAKPNGAQASAGPPTLRAQDTSEPSAPRNGEALDWDERIRRAAERLQIAGS